MNAGNTKGTGAGAIRMHKPLCPLWFRSVPGVPVFFVTQRAQRIDKEHKAIEGGRNLPAGRRHPSCKLKLLLLIIPVILL